MMSRANLDITISEILGITGGTGNVKQEILHPKPLAKIPRIVEDEDVSWEQDEEFVCKLDFISLEDSNPIVCWYYQLLNDEEIVLTMIRTASRSNI